VFTGKVRSVWLLKGLVLLQVKGKKSERRNRQVGWGDALLGRALQDAEVPQGRK
jgi:hypothetical protein